MGQEDRVPQSLKEAVLAWISRRFGSRGVLIALAVFAGVPASVFIYQQWQARRVAHLSDTRSELETLITSADAFQISVTVFDNFDDAAFDRPPIGDARVGEQTRVARSDDSCIFEITEERQSTLDPMLKEGETIVGSPLHLGTWDETWTTRFLVADVARIEVIPYNGGIPVMAKQRVSNTVYEPFTVKLINEDATPIFDVTFAEKKRITDTKKVIEEAKSEPAEHWSSNDLSIQFADLARANATAKAFLQMIDACSSRATVPRGLAGKDRLVLGTPSAPRKYQKIVIADEVPTPTPEEPDPPVADTRGKKYPLLIKLEPGAYMYGLPPPPGQDKTTVSTTSQAILQIDDKVLGIYKLDRDSPELSTNLTHGLHRFSFSVEIVANSVHYTGSCNGTFTMPDQTLTLSPRLEFEKDGVEASEGRVSECHMIPW
jgi:hypothetical protein